MSKPEETPRYVVKPSHFWIPKPVGFDSVTDAERWARREVARTGTEQSILDIEAQGLVATVRRDSRDRVWTDVMRSWML